MKHRPVNDTSYLIGGALLGAAAMYFLDPNMGDRRRRRVATVAEGAYGQARDAVSEQLHGVSGRLKDLAHAVTEHVASGRQYAGVGSHALAAEARKIASDLTDQAMAVAHQKQSDAVDYGHHMSDIGHRLWDRARGWGSRLAHLGDSVAGQAHEVAHDVSHRADDWRQWASGRAASARSRAQSLFGREERHTGVGAAAASTAVACCAVGAGMMYFLDPMYGRKRREQVWKQTSDLVGAAGNLMRATGNDLMQKIHGAVGEGVMGGPRQIDSRRLLDEIRGRIGQIIANPHAIQLITDPDGTVTVTGNLTRDELSAMLTRLHDVPGVSHIINRVTILEPAASSQAAMGTSAAAK